MKDAAEIVFPFAPPAPGEAVEVAEGVLWLRIPLESFRPDHVNAYALDDGDGWSVVDTGLDTPRTRQVWEALLAGPLAGRPVRRVLLTHHHPDHVGLAGWLQARGAELWATRTAWLATRMLTLDEQERPRAETLAYWRAGGMPEDVLAERAGRRPFNYADCVAPLPLGFRAIAQDDEIVAGGRRWRVEIGHGHAPEQATLWGIGHELVVVGDQVLPGITPNLGVYATEPEADPVGEWLVSCRRLGALAAPGQLALPGHRRPFLGLGARLAELAEHGEAGLDRLAAHLVEPQRATDCFGVLYGRAIGSGEYLLALGEAVGHLNRLVRTGRALRRRGEDGAWRWQAVACDEKATDTPRASR
ncbi:MAG: MBL fold metallo-hydrolase [Amaricoccus sp.]|uniref:MBL fold metallo-hydrolase n=1 Tax=Amaricoccus sp. TaxID=1872485 RepID=UPI0039E6C403